MCSSDLCTDKARALSVHSGEAGREVMVRLRMDGWAGRLAGERRWHATQEVEPLPGGRLEIRLRLSGLDEVFRWAMSWGEHVEVMEPPELRDRVRTAAQAMAARHGAPPA